MLESKKVFSSFSVSDLPKAKKIYTELLGIETKDDPMGIMELHAGDNLVMVYPKPNHTPATFTVLNFVVADIDKAVDELISKGVVFEHYDIEHIKTDEKGIVRGNDQSPNIAWFKDPFGNIMSVIQDK